MVLGRFTVVNAAQLVKRYEFNIVTPEGIDIVCKEVQDLKAPFNIVVTFAGIFNVVRPEQLIKA